MALKTVQSTQDKVLSVKKTKSKIPSSCCNVLTKKSKNMTPIQETERKDVATKYKTYTTDDLHNDPNILIGAKIKHKWKVNRKYVHLNGEITGITKCDIKPDDSDNEDRSNETCYDVKYYKYKNNVYHYRILPDIKSKDLLITSFADSHSTLIV